MKSTQATSAVALITVFRGIESAAVFRFADKFHANLGSVTPAETAGENSILTVNYKLESLWKAFQWHAGKPSAGDAHVLEFAKYTAAIMANQQRYLLVEVVARVSVSSVAHHGHIIDMFGWKELESLDFR